MKYAYQRSGAPILDWSSGPPRQSRAADAAALGSLGGTTLSTPTLVLPRPGAPEPILGGMGGCSCSGSCGCSAPATATGDVSDLVDQIPGGVFTLAAAAFIAWKIWGKRKRR